ncbi:MAG: hypothetical protein AAF928_15725 [Myxococcota bacterium]
MKNKLRFPLLALALTCTTGLVGCGDDDDDMDVEMPDEENEEEVITTVGLTFTPSAGSAVTAEWRDADGDGGMDPTVEDISLTAGETYTLTITLTNELEDPAEDITEEIEEEDDEHQFFFGGTLIESPTETEMDAIATFAYADMDGGGLPIGLSSTVTANVAGSTSLQVVLRHLPPVNDQAIKVADLDATFVASGASGLPGDSDVDVSFTLNVQ